MIFICAGGIYTYAVEKKEIIETNLAIQSKQFGMALESLDTKSVLQFFETLFSYRYDWQYFLRTYLTYKQYNTEHCNVSTK